MNELERILKNKETNLEESIARVRKIKVSRTKEIFEELIDVINICN